MQDLKGDTMKTLFWLSITLAMLVLVCPTWAQDTPDTQPQDAIPAQAEETTPTTPGAAEVDDATVARTLEQIEEMWGAGKQADAVKEAEFLYRQVPTDLTVIRELSKMYLFMSRRDDAIALYEQAVKDHPDDATVELQLKILNAKTRREQIALQREYAQTLDTPDKEIALAKIAERVNDPDEALLQWKKAAEFDPTTGESLENAFRVALQLKDWDAAQWAIDHAQAHDIDSRQFEALLDLAQGNYDDAIATLDELIAEDSTNRRARMLLGRVYFQQDDYDKAEEIFLALIEDDPTDTEPVVTMVHLAMEQDDKDKWTTWSYRLKELDPNNRYVPTEIRDPQEDTMSVDELLAVRLEIYEDNPLDTENIYRLGRLYEQSGNKPGAERMFRLLYDMMQDKAVGGAVLLGYYDRTNQMDKAELVVRDMLAKLDDTSTPDDKSAPYLLWGQILGKRNVTQGLASLDEAIKLNPTDIVAYDAKASLLTRHGRWTEAADVLGECQTMLEADDEQRTDLLQGITKLRVRYLIEANQIAEARELIDAMLAVDPDDHEAVALDGVLLTRQGDNDDALKQFTRAIELNPNFKAALVERGRLYLTKGDFPNAKEDFEKARGLVGMDVQIGVQLATAYRQMGNLNAAEEIYNDVLDADPTCEPAVRGLMEIRYYNRDWTRFYNLTMDGQRRFNAPYYYLFEADMWRDRGDTIRMIAAMEKGLDRHPDNAGMARSYLLALIEVGRGDDAIPLAEAYHDHDEFGPWAKAISGRVFAMQGEDAKADALFADALTEAPSDQLAIVMQQIGEGYGIAKALTKLDTLREHRPDDPQLLIVMASMARQVGDSDATLGYLDDALTLATEEDALASIHFLYGQTCYTLGRWEESAEAYEEALVHDPDNPRIMNDLAWVYAEDLDRAGDAKSLAEEAARLLPMEPQVLDTTGWVYYKLQKYEDASRYLVRSINITPMAYSRYHLGMTYEAMDKTDDALLQYEQARAIVGQDAGLAAEINAAIARLKQ
jgi:tetratricopeptide (TPR) repeat protein